MNSFRTMELSGLPSSSMLGKDLSGVVEALVASPFTLLACKLVIGFVSAYDIHQTVKYFEFLPEMELNPIGRWLMNLDNGPRAELQQAACFITAKFAGNFVCLAIIELLCNWNRRVATGVALPVALFQLVLLHFLVFGHQYH